MPAQMARNNHNKLSILLRRKTPYSRSVRLLPVYDLTFIGIAVKGCCNPAADGLARLGIVHIELISSGYGLGNGERIQTVLSVSESPEAAWLLSRL
jgi:hypothetical protein